MSMRRITITIPDYLYEDLVQTAPKRGVSSFVTEALEKELIKTDTDPIKQFINLRKRLPKKKKADIIKAIKKGRI